MRSRAAGRRKTTHTRSCTSLHCSFHSREQLIRPSCHCFPAALCGVDCCQFYRSVRNHTAYCESMGVAKSVTII